MSSIQHICQRWRTVNKYDTGRVFLEAAKSSLYYVQPHSVVVGKELNCSSRRLSALISSHYPVHKRGARQVNWLDNKTNTQLSFVTQEASVIRRKVHGLKEGNPCDCCVIDS